MRVLPLSEGHDKSACCRAIIDALPSWFGIPESNEAYVRKAATMPFLAALAGDEWVGGLAMRVHFGKVAEIHWMGVLPAYHRRGAGRLLVRAAFDEARRRGCGKMVVETLSARSPSEHYAQTRRFCEAMGFEPFLETHLESPKNAMMWMLAEL